MSDPPLVTVDPTPVSAYTGTFTPENATRLLWRAGFGPQPGQAAALTQLGLDGGVESLTRPVGNPVLTGAWPRGAIGQLLDPMSVWGDAHV